MEPSKEAIAVRITRLNRQILGKVTSGSTKFTKKTIDREALLDALTALYDECNDDPIKRTDELVRVFVDKYRSTLAELRRTRVCFSDFEILQTIGRGYFGEVHMVREKQTSDVYALKSVKKELARKRVAGAEDERDVLAIATSPWMPRLQYAFQDSSNLYLVMELCSGGDLAGLLARRNHPLSERDAAFYVCEVAHALKALHGMGYVHRDVKPHNVLLDRCGHVKLGDFGSSTRLSEGATVALPCGTADYVAPELLAAAHCASTHAVCSQYCQGIVAQAISACDYWSLGVVAFELVTLRRPFSSDDEDSVPKILSNIQRYERDPDPQPPFEPSPNGPSSEWRALVAGLLRVQPARRYNYLDTLQHPALAHIPVHSIRDQAPPWVPCVRGPEDTAYFSTPPRVNPPPSAAPFRSRPPFAGQLPFVGYSYVAPDDNEDSSGGFNASHDCTAIDLATFKSAEKLAAMRSREITSLQNRLAAAETMAGASADRARRDADADAERTRAKLQAEITALTLQNKRLERQIEVEKEERMVLQRTNQELTMGIAERNGVEVRNAKADAERAIAERNAVRNDMSRLEMRVEELQAELSRALAAADAQRAQHQHYKDSVAKERAIRRQTLSGGEAESRDVAARLAAAEANLARETRAREVMEKRLASLDEEYEKVLAQNKSLQAELDDARRQMASTQESLNQKQRLADASDEQLNEVQMQLAQERVRVSTLQAQVQELERGVEESVRRETAMEEQCARTEARLNERLETAENRAANATRDDARHREKVNTLEQLVRQLEREVSALEARGCMRCAARDNEPDFANRSGEGDGQTSDRSKRDVQSDTESVDFNTANVEPTRGNEAVNAQLTLLKEQLEKAEAQLQARAEEMATLRQEARSANLARWRKEREFNDLAVEAKTAARDLKRLEERLSSVVEARKKAEQKATALQSEMATLKPQYEKASKDVEQLKEQLARLKKAYETAQAEVDRSRNDIRKLKSELQYSEKRRMHAEEQEELSARERAHLRDETHSLRVENTQLVQVFKRKSEKPAIRPKPAYLRVWPAALPRRVRDGAWARRVRFALAADLVQGRCRAADNAIAVMNNQFIANNKALQEACSVLEEQLTDFEKLADIHELKNKDLEGEMYRLRADLEVCRHKLETAQKQATELGAAATLATSQHEEARDQASHAHCQLQLLREKLESREGRVAELESRIATLEGSLSANEAALNSAARRIRDLQEECSMQRTRAHEHHSNSLQLQAALADAQEELAAAREAAEAATAWWRTRETKTDATLRQQAKLIDFLQAKVEEAARKKCSLSNKLFGRSGRRNASSPPLRRANRELRDEVDRLRAKLAASNSSFDINSLPPTPRREKTKINGVKKSIDLPDSSQDDDSLLVVWSDDTRERMRATCADGVLTLKSGDRELTARLFNADAKDLPQNEANRAFTIKVENSVKGSTAAVVCSNLSSRSSWLSRLQAPPATISTSYVPTRLTDLGAEPTAALYIAPNAIAIGSKQGLHSLRGAVRVSLEGDTSPPRRAGAAGVTALAGVNGRVLLVCSGMLLQGGLLSLGSTLRRASTLQPSVEVSRVTLPDGTVPHLVKSISGSEVEGGCAAVACGRRVFLLRLDSSTAELKLARSFTVDRAPSSLLLTPTALYIAGEKPLRVNLPAGVIEPFAMDEPTVAAAARSHSPPTAILLLRPDPLELLLCYAECGVFLDRYGKRTRNEDPRWSSAIQAWEFIHPFLYVIGDDKITIIYINEEAYRSPPCTCETTSLHSSGSECYNPQTFQLKVKEPVLLGTSPNGIIIRTKEDEGYNVSIVEGMAAFRSIGASVESLETVSDAKGSSTDLVQSINDLLDTRNETQDVSQESVETTTGFLADIRKRARQLRAKNRQEQSDEVIKQILTTEIGLKRSSTHGRKSPATTSEFDSDSTDSEERTETTKGTSDLCAEMFTRQVRFQ